MAKGKTFGDASRAWLERVEHFKGVEATTLRNYRVIVGKLYPTTTERLPLTKVSSARIDAYQERLLTAERPLARRTVRTRMLVLGSIHERAAELSVGSRRAR